MVTGIVVFAGAVITAQLAGLYWFCWRKQGHEFKGEEW